MASRITKTHKNVMVVGESGSGKSLLCSVVTNPLRDEGHYFLDPDFVGANVRINENHGVSFIDTKPLTFNIADTRDNLLSIVSEMSRRHLPITGWIFCVRYGRIKTDCVRLLNCVISVAREPVEVYISNCSGQPVYMMDYFRERCGIEIFYWMKADVEEEMDSRLGRWIADSSQVAAVRETILERHGV